MEINKKTEQIMTNEIDLKILRSLLIKSYSLTELAEEVGIAYKNLLPHVRKLEEQKWLMTKQEKNSRGQKVIVSSKRKDIEGRGLIDSKWKDLFTGRTGENAEKEILKIIKRLNKKATFEAITYLTDLNTKNVWKNLLEGLLNKGYIQAKFEITKEGNKWLEERIKLFKS